MFLVPVLLAIAALFLYAFYALGTFALQAMQRRAGKPEGFELLWRRGRIRDCAPGELEVLAVRRLEVVRIAPAWRPMLGLVATMNPMGPALKSLGDGRLADVSQSLTVAFSAVILALLASAITYWIANCGDAGTPATCWTSGAGGACAVADDAAERCWERPR